MSTRVCPYIDGHGRSCPNLQPCPTHGRDPNARWSPGRDGAQQARERRDALSRDRFTCQRCGRVDPTGRALDAHHVTPTQVVTLCNECHCVVDPHARRRS